MCVQAAHETFGLAEKKISLYREKTWSYLLGAKFSTAFPKHLKSVLRELFLSKTGVSYG